MKLLILCDDLYHPSDVVIKGLDFLKERYTIDIMIDINDLNINIMRDYSLIIISKSNHQSSRNENEWLTDTLEQSFQDYVREGGKLLAIHSGIAGYENNRRFKDLLGGVFIHHPDPCNVSIEPIINHTITSGIQSFDVWDEHYFVEYNKSDVEVLIKTVSTAGEQPGGWIKTEGQGKVCVLTPGHFLEVWNDSNYKKLIDQSIQWLLIG